MKLNWYALSVKSKHEFVTRDELRKKKIETFLPSVMKLRQWSDRKMKVEFPLFPGYLFVFIVPHPEEFLPVMKTRGAAGLVCLETGHPTPVLPEEIQSLRTVIESGRPFDVYPRFQEGARVRIRRGPLRGAEGILAGKEEQDMFFVNIEILGRSVGLHICPDDIEQA